MVLSAILLAGLVTGNSGATSTNVFLEDFRITDSREFASIPNGTTLYTGFDSNSSQYTSLSGGDYHIFYECFQLQSGLPAANTTEEIYVVYGADDEIAVSLQPTGNGTISNSNPALYRSDWVGKKYLKCALTCSNDKLWVAHYVANEGLTSSLDAIKPLDPQDFGIAFSRTVTVGSDSTQKVTKIQFHVSKNTCNYDASIDTRKDYGDPGLRDNLDEHVASDPNNVATYVKFGASEVFGGLFVGCIPLQSVDHPQSDRSGLSRIQLRAPYNTTQDGTPLLVTPSLLQIGFATAFPNRLPLTCAVPQNDANFDKAEAETNWSVKWDLGGTNGTYYLCSDLQASVQTYAKYQISKQYDYVSSALGSNALCGSGNSGSQAAPALRAAFLLDDELNQQNEIVNGTLNGSWRYFASKEWVAGHPVNDYTQDALPRFWVLSAGSPENYPGN